MWWIAATLFVVMIDVLVDSFMLSSQVGALKQRDPTPRPPKNKSTADDLSGLLVPSQVVKRNINLHSSLSATFGVSEGAQPSEKDDSAASKPAATSTSRRRRKPKKKPTKRQLERKDQPTQPQMFPTTGNLPDIYWRAISMEHLRQHPCFRPLPHSVTHLETLQDVSQFRQDSWQWDALHEGRCTTSQAVAALGFLEPTTGEVLGIAPAWRRGGLGAYHRLRKTPLRSLEEMRSRLCDDVKLAGPEGEPTSQNIWSLVDDASSPFCADYIAEASPNVTRDRREHLKKLAKGDYLDRGIRMMWGNTQEATSVLTALNYFCRQQPGTVIQEIGMAGAGLEVNQTRIESSLLVGASSDAVIAYPDGSIEALEVKNHCPFFSNRGRKRHGGKVKRFSIGDRPFADKYLIFTQYVPQLQMEMYCLGPKCRSAVMVRQTATQGAIIIQMKRDDEWIEEMLHWLHTFQSRYVETETPPPRDFFWCAKDMDDQSRYRRFVHRTLTLRNEAKIVARIPAENIQRSEPHAPFFLD